MPADPLTSILLILIVGIVAGAASRALRLPRIVLVVLAGIALAPALHPTVLTPSPVPGAVSPASSLRSFALLVALARGGLTMLAGERRATLSRLRVPIALLACVPYALELVVEAAAARVLLPAAAGLGTDVARGTTVALLAASLWAPLSPSIVLPNMLAFGERGLLVASSTVGTAAPFEIATALVVFSTLEALLRGGGAGAALGWAPVSLLASLALGAAAAASFEAYARARNHPRALALLQAPEASEALGVWLALFALAYLVAADGGAALVPKTIGFVAALAMAVTTALRLPGHAAAFATTLKGVWFYAEAFLFVLTGVVIRSAVDAAASPALSPGFVAVLVCGSLARALGDVLAAAAWVAVDGAPAHGGGARGAARALLQRASPRAVAQRAALLWATTMPKATLQASLGPKPLADAAVLGLPPATALFMEQSAGVAILYCATLGSLLTFSIGAAVARTLEDEAANGGEGSSLDAAALLDDDSEVEAAAAAGELLLAGK